MLCIQRLNSRREHGWVRLQEILVRIGPLRTVGTTPVLAIASMAPTGEATNSLGKHLQGTDCNRTDQLYEIK